MNPRAVGVSKHHPTQSRILSYMGEQIEIDTDTATATDALLQPALVNETRLPEAVLDLVSSTPIAISSLLKKSLPVLYPSTVSLQNHEEQWDIIDGRGSDDPRYGNSMTTATQTRDRKSTSVGLENRRFRHRSVGQPNSDETRLSRRPSGRKCRCEDLAREDIRRNQRISVSGTHSGDGISSRVAWQKGRSNQGPIRDAREGEAEREET